MSPEAKRPPSRPSDNRRFANPYNACTTCGVRVHWWTVEGGNDPCGHRGSDKQVSAVSIGKQVSWNEHVEPWKSLCPSWGPVDGCECSPPCALPPEAS